MAMGSHQSFQPSPSHEGTAADSSRVDELLRQFRQRHGRAGVKNHTNPLRFRVLWALIRLAAS